MRYGIAIEQGENSYGAYVPDLPGCVAAAPSREEVIKLIHEAIAEHICILHEEGMQVPAPHSTAEYAEVEAA